MKVWVAKYALSKGIYEVDVEPPEADSDYVYTTTPYRAQFRLEKDAFVDRKEAVKEADRLRKDLVESILRKIEKLSDLKEADRSLKDQIESLLRKIEKLSDLRFL